jgi:hypothetical protein
LLSRCAAVSSVLKATTAGPRPHTRVDLGPFCCSIVTHNLVDDANDPVLNAFRRCQLFNNSHDRVKVCWILGLLHWGAKHGFKGTGARLGSSAR